ncbi:PucR family transcriptional regulator [Pseudonocardia parietis]|uniref:Purine catabolism regulator n=1 Tax=Pseudonocardia parietis TaxID=570936 RepID=A0ABS4VSZ6_9PSEU|nr:PucR family transcriptional regulator [Pseudonocardia parietis]MBP2367053.1 purine catabolism regulator [Pseudonocardia parietis]
MYPTIAEVLARPEVRCGAPVVRAGRDALDAEVRWVHVSELADPAGTLPEGVLVLSVGLPAADPTTDPARYVDAVRAAGAVGLVVEIGQHLTALPGALVQAARAAGFPLVELRRTVRFADIVAGVLARILTARHDRAAFAEHAGTVFRTLTLHGAAPGRVVDEAAALLGAPVVAEDLAHRVLLSAGAPDLRDWRARSRLAGPAGPEGWEVAPLGRPGTRWGRLVVPSRPAPDTADRVATVLGHAADALSLLGPDPGALLRAAHDRLVGELAAATPVDVEGLAVRARACGVPVTGEVEVVLLAGPAPAELRSLVETTLPDAAPGALVATLPGSGGADDEQVPAVAVLVPAGSPGDRLAARVAAAGPVVATVAGPGPFETLPELLREARLVAAARQPGPQAPVPPGGPHRRSGLGVRGLAWQLRDDPRLLGFVEETLGPVLALDAPERARALHGLHALVDAGGVVADVARRIGTGRPAAYARIRTLSALLGADLADPEVRTAVHLALLALR